MGVGGTAPQVSLTGTACPSLRRGADCASGAREPLGPCWGFGAGAGGPRAPGLGTLPVLWGQGEGTPCVLLGAGTRDPRVEPGVRLPGPSDGGQAMGTFALESGSGCGDPRVAPGVTEGPSGWSWGGDMGTFAWCSGWGPSGWGWGQDLGTLLVGSVGRDLGPGVSSWGPAWGTRSISPGTAGGRRGDGGSRLCLSPPAPQGR